jgi:hypothetical protein
MIQAPRTPRAPREEQRVANHHLLDERGADLGTVGTPDDGPTFGPMEPTVYLRREPEQSEIQESEIQEQDSNTRPRPSDASQDEREGVR